MPTARRYFFLRMMSGGFRLIVVWCFFLSLPLAAQSPYMEFHGVPPFGIGGSAAARTNANGYGTATAFGCCASFFFPSSFSPMVPYPSPGTEERGNHGHHRRASKDAGVVAEAVYVPYGVPYAEYGADDAADEPADEPDGVATAEAEQTEIAGDSAVVEVKARRQRGAAKGAAGTVQPGEEVAAGEATGDGRDNESEQPAEGDAGATRAPEPMVAQPTTVLVFKDGHRGQVVNYAIVGDTLFDFSGDRTHKILLSDLDVTATQKANDAVGVEFKLPPDEAK